MEVDGDVHHAQSLIAAFFNLNGVNRFQGLEYCPVKFRVDAFHDSGTRYLAFFRDRYPHNHLASDATVDHGSGVFDMADKVLGELDNNRLIVNRSEAAYRFLTRFF